MLINDVYWLSFHMLTMGLRSASRRSGQQDSLVYRLSLQGILDRSEGTYRTVKKCIKIGPFVFSGLFLVFKYQI